MGGVDEELFRELNAAGSSAALDAVMLAATVVGLSYVLALLAVPIWLSGRKEQAFDLLIVIAVTLLVTDLLKLVIDRSRPCDAIDDVNLLACVGCPSDPSMPSGHSSRAFGVALLVASSFSRRTGVLAYSGAAMIGLSRVYLGVHWPSDVVVGAFLGMGLALVVLALARRSRRYQSLRSRFVRSVDSIARRAAASRSRRWKLNYT